MKLMHHKWQPEQIEQIKNLLLEGKSYGQIAKELKVTKNAVIGIAHRSNIVIERKKKEKTVKITTTPNIIVNFKPVKCKPLPIEIYKPNLPVPFPPPPGFCLSIVGEASALKCCGRPIVKESSWCAEHHKIYMVQSK